MTNLTMRTVRLPAAMVAVAAGVLASCSSALEMARKQEAVAK